MLDRAARAPLRTLSKPNAEAVAGHLVMAGRLMDEDPEEAYLHARAAVRRAGRVDVVREALALTAYATGRYAEALREVRTVRRLSGVDAHPVIEADCERGLGRPERALTVIAEAKQRRLPVAEAVELTLVESGARADLGEHDAALLVLDKLLPSVKEGEPRRRLLLVRADRLETLGRHDEAATAREEAGGLEPDSIVVVDLVGDEEPEDGAADAAVPAGADEPAPEGTEEAVDASPERTSTPDPEDEPATEGAVEEPEATPETSDAESESVPDAPSPTDVPASEVPESADVPASEGAEPADVPASEGAEPADVPAPEAPESADVPAPEASELADESATEEPAADAADAAEDAAGEDLDETAPAMREDADDSTPQPAETDDTTSAPEQVQLDLFADTEPEEQQ